MDESPHFDCVQSGSWYNHGRVYSDGTRCMLPGYLGSLRSVEDRQRSLKETVELQSWFKDPFGEGRYPPVLKVSIVDSQHGRTLEVVIPKRINWDLKATSSIHLEPFKIQDDGHAKSLRWATNRAFQASSEEDRMSLINDPACALKTVQSWFTTATGNLEDLLQQYPDDPSDSIGDESDFDCQDRASCITRLIVRSHPQLPHNPTALETAMSALHFGEEMDPSAYRTVHNAAFYNPNAVDNDLTEPFNMEVGEIVPFGDPGSVTYGIQALHRHILRLAEKRQDLADLGIELTSTWKYTPAAQRDEEERGSDRDTEMDDESSASSKEPLDLLEIHIPGDMRIFEVSDSREPTTSATTDAECLASIGGFLHEILESFVAEPELYPQFLECLTLGEKIAPASQTLPSELLNACVLSTAVCHPERKSVWPANTVVADNSLTTPEGFTDLKVTIRLGDDDSWWTESMNF